METSQTADYALLVLLELERRDGRTISEIAQTLDVGRSVAQRIVATLHERAMLTRGEGGRFWLGPGLIPLGQNVIHELAAAAGGSLRSLSESSGETVVLAVPEGREAHVVARSRGRIGPLRVEYEVGFRHPLSRGASGLAILAYLDADDSMRREVAPGVDLDRIREQGFARSVGQIRPDMVGLAAPIFDDRGVVGSVAIISPTARAQVLDEHIASLHETSRDIGGALTGTRRRSEVVR